MKDEAPELILLFIFLNAIAWVLIAPVVATAPDHGWLWIIKEYQNLIAGLLAIVAAVITVNAMMHVDGRQAQRHRELIALSWRKDALALDRYFGRVTSSVEGFSLINRSITELRVNNSGEAFLNENAEKIWRLVDGIERILKFPFLGDEQSKVEHLLDSSTELKILRFQTSVSKMEFRLEDMEWTGFPRRSGFVNPKMVGDQIDWISINIPILLDELNSLHSDVSAIRDKYATSGGIAH